MSDLDTLDLIKLFLAARDGSRTPQQEMAWEDFVHIHEPLIQNIIKNCTGCTGDVQDLFQEVWITLIRKLPKLKYDPARGPLRAWVTVVARRAALKAARDLRRSRADALTPEVAAVLIDPGPGPISLLEHEQERQWVRSRMATLGAKLPELTHRIMVLHWIDNQLVPEIAAALELSEDRVRMRLQRAFKKLGDHPGDS